MMQEKRKPQLQTKAIVYAPICDNNHIAAAILDWLYTYAEIFQRIKDLEPYSVYVESAYGNLFNPSAFSEYLNYEVDVDGNLNASLEDLRSFIVPQLTQPFEVTDDDIFDAIELLNNKQLAYFESYIYDKKREPYAFFNILMIYELRIDALLIARYTGQSVEIPQQPLYDRKREQRIIREQRSRAARIGQAATLTIEEWIKTLEYFEVRCAFDKDHPYQVLEHFIPIIQGGGTTIFNCIPACAKCNAIKRDQLPLDVENAQFQAALPRIQTYLNQCYENQLETWGYSI